ncbi:MAG: trypsin-like peptidase domain-containing protein, partial [Thermoguttaceae bacterium]|nr:trypsin-like peptidase domain-containing protein [Thermoguttaceae bacterium]
FDFFFGYEQAPRQRELQGSGSGVIIREDGYIVTNNHVVDGATKIEVTLNNNKTYTATLVGTDPATDVALIKIDASGLPTVPFGNSDNLRLGEWVIAIGSPYDLRSTITAGIVSAKGRSMPNYNGEFKIESFIQTDAAVNPGNSGGALMDKNGNLVGINTAIISQTGSYTGYSFAIPSNMVKKIVSDLIDFGSVRRAMLGITFTPIDRRRSSVMNELIERRAEIDAVDAELIRLFRRRMNAVARIAAYKKELGLPILSVDREREIVLRNAAFAGDGLELYAKEFLEDLIDLSRRYQTETIGRAEEI